MAVLIAFWNGFGTVSAAHLRLARPISRLEE